MQAVPNMVANAARQFGLTEEDCSEIGIAAGYRHAKRHGRTTWNHEDFAEAAKVRRGAREYIPTGTGPVLIVTAAQLARWKSRQ